VLLGSLVKLPNSTDEPKEICNCNNDGHSYLPIRQVQVEDHHDVSGATTRTGLIYPRRQPTLLVEPPRHGHPLRQASRPLRCHPDHRRHQPMAPSMAQYGLEAGSSGLLGPQLTAFFTSAPILASSAAVNSVRAKAVGHMAPSSRFALSLKPNVA
jgi:hypothetical protein